MAATGIAVPIGLSFVLLRLVDGTSRLSAFAAGAALCSTSLGTAFTVLRASGLATTRLGVVLAGAAMLDDVVGLVMVQVIASLGSAGGHVPALTVVRPILVSVALAVAAGVLCRFVVQPLAKPLHRWRAAHPDALAPRLLRQPPTACLLQTSLLLALVVGASYAETSNLFAAYVAGALVSWWDGAVAEPANTGTAENARNGMTSTSGPSVFAHYYAPAAKWILQPFFFASIGFSIPIAKMFRGAIVWKGFVYAALMALGKLVCGLWLVRFPSLPLWAPRQPTSEPTNLPADQTADQPADLPESKTAQAEPARDSPSRNAPDPPKPLSLYPAAILGLAMVPRGEIGFLISAVAQSHGVLGDEEDAGESDIFLIVTWAIVLCTVLGPPCVGLLVRRVRRLEGQAAAQSGPRDVLGVWGVTAAP